MKLAQAPLSLVRNSLSAVAAVTLSFATVASVLLLLSTPVRAAEEAPAACLPTLEATPVEFPSNAQRLGQFGRVRISILVSDAGQAKSVAVDQSSGYALLDRAAVSSVQRLWKFGVAHCNAAALNQVQTIDVVFARNSKQPTASLAANLATKADKR